MAEGLVQATPRFCLNTILLHCFCLAHHCVWPKLFLSGIKQFYIAVDREEWKLDTLCDLYETLTITQAIIYCNTRRRVDWLSEKMQVIILPVACRGGIASSTVLASVSVHVFWDAYQKDIIVSSGQTIVLDVFFNHNEMRMHNFDILHACVVSILFPDQISARNALCRPECPDRFT